MAKGDVVKVVYRTGAGVTTEEFVAGSNGRYFKTDTEKDTGLSWIWVREYTRGGTEVRSASFRAEDVMMIRHDRLE